MCVYHNAVKQSYSCFYHITSVPLVEKMFLSTQHDDNSEKKYPRKRKKSGTNIYALCERSFDGNLSIIMITKLHQSICS